MVPPYSLWAKWCGYVGTWSGSAPTKKTSFNETWRTHRVRFDQVRRRSADNLSRRSDTRRRPHKRVEVNMTYIGPTTSLSPSATNRLRAGYSPEHDMPVGKQVSDTQPLPTIYERRRAERRKTQRHPVLDLRIGDRRRTRPRIDIEV